MTKKSVKTVSRLKVMGHGQPERRGYRGNTSDQRAVTIPAAVVYSLMLRMEETRRVRIANVVLPFTPGS